MSAPCGRPRGLQVKRTRGSALSAKLSPVFVARSNFDARSGIGSRSQKDDFESRSRLESGDVESRLSRGFPDMFPDGGGKALTLQLRGKRGSAWGPTPEHGFEDFVLVTRRTSKLPWRLKTRRRIPSQRDLGVRAKIARKSATIGTPSVAQRYRIEAIEPQSEHDIKSELAREGSPSSKAHTATSSPCSETVRLWHSVNRKPLALPRRLELHYSYIPFMRRLRWSNMPLKVLEI